MAERRPKPPRLSFSTTRRSTDEDAKDLITYILEVAGGELECKTRLYKAFYGSHLVYHRLTNDFLTAHPIVHMPHGPGIDDGERLLAELVQAGRIRIHFGEDDIFPGEQTFQVIQPYNVDPEGPRHEAVAHAVKWVRSKSAGDLSIETHEKSKSWNATHDGDEMNIYLDLVPDHEIERRRESVEEIDRLVSTAFGR
jgi:hypothetical protein